MVWYKFFERADPRHIADSLDTAKEGDVPGVMGVPEAPRRGAGRPRRKGTGAAAKERGEGAE